MALNIWAMFFATLYMVNHGANVWVATGTSFFIFVVITKVEGQ